MHACPRCWEAIEHPSLVAAPASEATISGVQVHYAPAPADQTAPVPSVPQGVHEGPHQEPYQERGSAPEPAAPWQTSDPPAPGRPRKRRRGRFVLTAILAAVVLTVILIALEAAAPLIRRSLPDQVRLSTQTFSDLKFAVGIPRGWEARREDVSNLPGVTVHEPASQGDVGRLRSFNIVEVPSRDYDQALQLADRKAPASAQDYREIDIVSGLTIDDSRAFRHRYTDGEEYREEWWVEHGDGTFRLEFSAPVSRREESASLYVRIARSFDAR